MNQENTIPEEKKNDYMWILQNRIFRIFNVITEYGEDNFYVSFSGGKDSTVLSALIDMALPENKIPRVYANTGIELNMVRDFVFKMAKEDDRIKIIKPSVPIKQMLEKEGYPFKSKSHSLWHERYKRIGKSEGVAQYLGERTDKKPWRSENSCPKSLKYQFSEDFNTFKISDKCCINLKENPLYNYSKQSGRNIGINGVMKSEMGRRDKSVCLVFKGNKLKLFQPMTPLTKEWEEWFIQKFNIDICDIYKEPYNFPRTGCKGCPFIVNLQEQLDILQKFFPKEREQCEIIWKPVYDEYRRIGYRLKSEEQLSFSDRDFEGDEQE